MSRRRALGMAALITGAAGTAGTAGAVRAATRPAGGGTGKIDTHHHAVPPAMRKWAVDHGLLPPQGGPRWAAWTLPSTLETMDANGIAAGVASAPAPPEAFRDRKLALSGTRVFNESLADLVRDHPKRFGFFAYLPLLHVDVAIEEAAYALDELGADGVIMMNVAGGRYLGDQVYEPLFAELNRRRAVVLTHPAGQPGGSPIPGVEEYVVEYMAQTARTALNLITSGTLDRYPRLSVILSHAGGCLPYIRSRVERAGARGEGPPPEVFRRGLRRLYYDTAMPASPYATPTLLAAAGPDRLLFGTDWPQVPADEVASLNAAFERDPALDGRTRRAAARDNALRLLPRLAARLTR